MLLFDSLWQRLLLAGLVVAVGIAVIVIRRRLLARRVGADPHCHECDYNLRGLSAETKVCPECGAQLNLSARTGQRRPRWMSAALLTIAFLLAAGGAFYAFGQDYLLTFDWHRYLPLSMILSSTEADKSWAELELTRRSFREELAEEDWPGVVQCAMKKQAAAVDALDRAKWTEILHQMLDLGRLTDVQQEAFAAEIVLCELRSRRKVRPGDPLPIRLTCEPRVTYVGKLSIFTKFENVRLTVGGEPAPACRYKRRIPWQTTKNAWQSGAKTTSRCDWRLDELERSPGAYPLVCSYDVVISLHDWRSETPRRSWKLSQAVSAEVEVTPLYAEDPLVRRSGKEVDWQVQTSFYVGMPTSQIDWRLPAADRQEPKWSIPLSLIPQRLSCNVVADVYLRSGWRQWRVGGVALRVGSVGETVSLSNNSLDLEAADPADYRIILRSNANAARRTVDIDEIWEGAVVLPPPEPRNAYPRTLPPGQAPQFPPTTAPVFP